MNRRTLLRFAAIIALFVPARLRGVAAAPALPQADALRGFFRHPDSAAAIGRGYLCLCPEEADLHGLLARLLPDAEPPLAREDLRRALAARQAADFGSGRTLLLDGWVLSLTEARLCAAAALGLC
jgi:hypothetical protein